jgi:hypothetical protein
MMRSCSVTFLAIGGGIAVSILAVYSSAVTSLNVARTPRALDISKSSPRQGRSVRVRHHTICPYLQLLIIWDFRAEKGNCFPVILLATTDNGVKYYAQISWICARDFSGRSIWNGKLEYTVGYLVFQSALFPLRNMEHHETFCGPNEKLNLIQLSK